MAIIPLIESVDRTIALTVRQIVGQAAATVERDHIPVTVAERNHTPHCLVRRSQSVSRLYRPKTVTTSISIGRAMRRLGIVMRKVRLNRSHLYPIIQTMSLYYFFEIWIQIWIRRLFARLIHAPFRYVNFTITSSGVKYFYVAFILRLLLSVRLYLFFRFIVTWRVFFFLPPLLTNLKRCSPSNVFMFFLFSKSEKYSIVPLYVWISLRAKNSPK